MNLNIDSITQEQLKELDKLFSALEPLHLIKIVASALNRLKVLHNIKVKSTEEVIECTYPFTDEAGLVTERTKVWEIYEVDSIAAGPVDKEEFIRLFLGNNNLNNLD